MADTKLSGLNALTAVATNDYVEVLDVSDTVTMSAATGANKKVLQSDFLAGVYRAGGGTVVQLADGGTGATTANAARGSLGLGIGTAVQAWDADLDAFAGLTSGTNLFPYYTGSHTMGTANFVPWTTWSPTFSGWSGAPQGGVYRYTQVGTMVTLVVNQINVGTSNAATKSISLPVNAANPATISWVAPATVVDAGTTCLVGTYGGVANSGTAMTFHKGWGGLNGWTTSGTCRIITFMLTYESV